MIRFRGPLVLLVAAVACGSTDGPPTLREKLERAYGWTGGAGGKRAVEWLDERPEIRRRLFEPKTASLVRLLREDYGVRFHPREAGMLVAWVDDAAIRRRLEDGAVRAFARARRASGAMDDTALRFRGGRLWSDAVRFFAALARREGMGALVDALHRLYGYRLEVLDAPGLVRLLDDDALRAALLDEETAAGWRRFAERAKVRFSPDGAASVVVLGQHPEDGEVVRELRLKYRIRVTTSAALVSLARLAEEHGGLAALRAPEHGKLLRRLSGLLRRRLEPAELRGTLRLATHPQFDARVVEEARRAGWRPVFDDASVATLLRVCADRPLRSRLASWRPPPDVGARGAPRSLDALLDAATGAADPFDVWLTDNDLAFRPLLTDDRSHAELVWAILANRGERPTRHREDVTYDATGRHLDRLNRIDLLKILVVQRALAGASFRARLHAEVRADVADESAERGGLIHLEPDGSLRLETDALTGVGDGMHRLSERPDPKAVFATWHLHALGGAAYAGPSEGSVSDLASARRLGVDGLVVTPVEDGLNVDYYDTTGGVLDLGVWER